MAYPQCLPGISSLINTYNGKSLRNHECVIAQNAPLGRDSLQLLPFSDQAIGDSRPCFCALRFSTELSGNLTSHSGIPLEGIFISCFSLLASPSATLLQQGQEPSALPSSVARPLCLRRREHLVTVLTGDRGARFCYCISFGNR